MKPRGPFQQKGSEVVKVEAVGFGARSGGGGVGGGKNSELFGRSNAGAVRSNRG